MISMTGRRAGRELSASTMNAVASQALESLHTSGSARGPPTNCRRLGRAAAMGQTTLPPASSEMSIRGPLVLSCLRSTERPSSVSDSVCSPSRLASGLLLSTSSPSDARGCARAPDRPLSPGAGRFSEHPHLCPQPGHGRLSVAQALRLTWSVFRPPSSERHL